MGNYNGSCCTGIFQLNNANVQKYAGTDRAGYGCMSLQDQVDAWAKLTNRRLHPAVRQLASMSTFDGQKVDASFIAACIQLGTGNCQKMLNSGSCSGFADHQRHHHLTVRWRTMRAPWQIQIAKTAKPYARLSPARRLPHLDRHRRKPADVPVPLRSSYLPRMSQCGDPE